MNSYNWVIETKAGDTIKEFDDGKENNFLEIDNKSISKLSLVHESGLSISTTGNGFCIVDKDEISNIVFSISCEDKITPIDKFIEFIQYKGFESNAIGMSELSKNTNLNISTTSHHIGYRKWYFTEDIEFYIDYMFNIVLNVGVSVSCKIYGIGDKNVAVNAILDNGISHTPMIVTTEIYR